jgi:hypothetical protein
MVLADAQRPGLVKRNVAEHVDAVAAGTACGRPWDARKSASGPDDDVAVGSALGQQQPEHCFDVLDHVAIAQQVGVDS